MKLSLLRALVIASLVVQAHAVEKNDGTTTGFNTTAPTGSDIPGWDAGWPQAGTTGWNYVGSVGTVNGGPSGVYLGNNWVLTAGHVGPGTFTLGGTSYPVVSGSQYNLTNPDSSPADLTLFQITTAPNLPALAIATAAPDVGASVAMLGFGGGQGETWGFNTVTENNVSVQVTGFSYTTTDFETDYAPPVNDYYLVAGDSGGGDFIYNSSTGQWELAGINEAIDESNNSYLVQLSAYASEINAITSTPEPSSAVFLGLGVPVLLWRSRRGRAFSGARHQCSASYFNSGTPAGVRTVLLGKPRVLLGATVRAALRAGWESVPAAERRSGSIEDVRPSGLDGRALHRLRSATLAISKSSGRQRICD